MRRAHLPRAFTRPCSAATASSTPSQQRGKSARSNPRQHLGGLPVLRRSGLAVQDADRRCAAAHSPGLSSQEFATIASALALIIALERIAVESEYQGKKPEDQAARLRYLEQKFAQYWEGRGDVAEAFGNAWSKVKGLRGSDRAGMNVRGAPRTERRLSCRSSNWQMPRCAWRGSALIVTTTPPSIGARRHQGCDRRCSTP